MEAVRARLLEAQEAREVLTIVYNGGSQPGTKRLVTVVSVGQDEARLHEENGRMPKSFKLAKIVIATEGSNADSLPAGWKSADVHPGPAAIDIPDAFAAYMDELKEAWARVELTADRCCVYYAAKVASTGRIFKAKIGVELAFRPFTGEEIVGSENGVPIYGDPQPNTRPYYVGGCGHSTTFGRLSAARDRFMSLARERSANGAGKMIGPANATTY